MTHRTLHFNRWLLPCVAALGVLLRLWVAWQPVPVLLIKNLPDDAFYYFMIARNTVQLGSVSIDGVSTTNGFHPLWWIALMPLFGWRAPLGDLQVHIALSAASMLEAVSIFGIGRIAARLTGRDGLGALAALLYAANPMAILQATNGLETALGMATLTAFWLQMLRTLNRPPSWKSATITGALGGLMFLARSDSVFFLAFALLALLWFGGMRSAWRGAALIGIVALVVIAPWFIWSRIAVGSWLQESGVAVPFAIRARLALEDSSAAAVWRESLRQLTAPAFWLRGDPTGLPLVGGVLMWLIALAGLAWRWRRSAPRVEMAALLPLLVASAALIVFHAAIRWYPRPWYFIPAAAAWSVCFVVAAASFLHRRALLFSMVVVSLSYFLISGYAFWWAGFYPWQREMRDASDWIAQNSPNESELGSFNSGIYAYYSGRRVVNLDGVVNHDAYVAVKNRSVLPYLRRVGIDLLIDYDSAVRREYAPFLGAGYPDSLTEIAVLGGQADGPLGFLRVYRIGSAP